MPRRWFVPILVLSLILSLVLPAAGCKRDLETKETGTDQKTSAETATVIPYKKGKNHVIIEMVTNIPFASTVYGDIQVPEFILYGDGTVIFHAVDEPTLNTVKLKEEEIQELLGYIDARDFFYLEDEYTDAVAPDMGTTDIVVNLVQGSKVVSIYAAPMAGEQKAIPDQLQQVYAKLANFKAKDAKEYDPGKAYFYSERLARPTREAGAIRTWNVRGIDPAAVAESAEGYPGRTMISGSTLTQAEDFIAEAAGKPNSLGPVEVRFGGLYFSVGLRPLLPDEL